MKKTAKITVEIDGENVAECTFTDVEEGEYNVDYDSGYATAVLIMLALMGRLMYDDNEEDRVIH